MEKQAIETIQLQLPLCVPQIGDVVFYVRRWNPVKGEVFDRYAILKKTISKILSHYYVADDREVLIPSRIFSDIEQAKECVLELQGFVQLVSKK